MGDMKLVVTLLILSSSASAFSVFTVDDFDSGPANFTSASATTAYYQYNVNDVFGGTRVVQWTKRNAVTSGWGVDTSQGVLFGNNGANANVYLASYYGFELDGSGNRSVRPNNWNLSSVTAFRIHFATAPTSGFLSMRLYNGQSGLPGTWRDYGFNFSTVNPSVANVSLTSNILSTSGPFDISSVDGFRVAFDVTGSNWQISKIEAVPEPATLAALAIGLGTLVRRRSIRLRRTS